VIHTVLSASESHNLANVNMTIAESIEKLRAVMQVAERAKTPVGCGVSTSFGCPFEGDVPLAQLESVVRRLVDIVYRIHNSVHNSQEMELSVLAAKDSRKEGQA